jgi:hypothetical protein
MPLDAVFLGLDRGVHRRKYGLGFPNRNWVYTANVSFSTGKRFGIDHGKTTSNR